MISARAGITAQAFYACGANNFTPCDFAAVRRPPSSVASGRLSGIRALRFLAQALWRTEQLVDRQTKAA